MTELWTYREEIMDPTTELDGFDVEAIDGHIGKIDHAQYEAGEAHIVVDTGFWIFGAKRLIPARAITRVDLDDEVVYLSLSKEQVKDAPDHDATRWADTEDRPRYRTQLTDYYEVWEY